jgi:hypothetical protein
MLTMPRLRRVILRSRSLGQATESTPRAEGTYFRHIESLLALCDRDGWLHSDEGWRHVKVTERRTAVDYAHVHFAKAEKIMLVQDNLNTHRPASLYEAFQPEECAGSR